MRISMLTIGSTGDVRPYVLLGRELKKRGHEITIAAFAPFREMAEEAGLHFFPLSGDVMNVMNNLMKPGVNGTGFLNQVEKSLKHILPTLLDDLMQSADGADAMCCTFFGSMFYSIAEKYHIPCIQTQYFPMDPNGVTPISSAPRLNQSKSWNLTSYKLGYFLISLLEKRYLTDWRKAQGLSVRKITTKPDYTLQGHTIPVIYAISPLVMPRPRRWGEHIHMSGFWWNDEPCIYEPDPALADFLAKGDKPLYIGFGSMVSGNMSKTFTTVVKAVRAANLRAIISLGWNGEKLRMKNDDHVFFADHIPHDWLFKQVSAVVHHGGAGTTASGLRAGKPTLVIPFGGDQPFWGSRVQALGCGPKPLRRENLTVARLTKSLLDLTNHASYRVAAEELAERLRMEHGVQRAADMMEQEIAAWKEADA